MTTLCRRSASGQSSTRYAFSVVGEVVPVAGFTLADFPPRPPNIAVIPRAPPTITSKARTLPPMTRGERDLRRFLATGSLLAGSDPNDSADDFVVKANSGVAFSGTGAALVCGVLSEVLLTGCGASSARTEESCELFVPSVPGNTKS